MDINFRNHRFFEKVVIVIIVFQSLFASVDPIFFNLVDPFQSVLLLVARFHPEISEWAHLSVYESVPEDELFSGDVRAFLRQLVPLRSKFTVEFLLEPLLVS